MKFINKENLQKKITINLDRKEYLKFIKDLPPICKKAEYNSNSRNLKYTIVINSVRVPYMPCKGITSRVIDKNKRISHIGMFDWDNLMETLLLDEVQYLYSLIKSPIYLFQSTKDKKDCNGDKYNNYMGITLLKKPFFDWIQIQKQLHTDVAHSIVAKSYRWKTFVLRMSKKNLKPKPIFFKIIDGGKKSFDGEISNAHKKFLELQYPEIKKLNKKYKFKLDKNPISNLFFTSYNTGSS